MNKLWGRGIIWVRLLLYLGSFIHFMAYQIGEGYFSCFENYSRAIRLYDKKCYLANNFID